MTCRLKTISPINKRIVWGIKQKNGISLKFPLENTKKKENGIQDFRSIRFMRMFLNDFDEEVVLRFARLNHWQEMKEDFDDLRFWIKCSG